MTYKSVSEVVAKLNDRSFCEPHIAIVNKGHGDLSYVEWHEACRMLDEVFGPFGWDGEVVGSAYYPDTGVYTVDLTLVGRAIDDETGAVLELKRPGRGVGIVPESARGAGAEHDRQAHGAKSDAITNATKALGDGFGLFLYSKGAKPAAPTTKTVARTGTATKKSSPTPKQIEWLLKKNVVASQAEAEAMSFEEASAALDKVFGNKSAAPAKSKAAAAARTVAPANEVDDLDAMFSDN